jgi:hypothetical protein
LKQQAQIKKTTKGMIAAATPDERRTSRQQTADNRQETGDMRTVDSRQQTADS